jgi:predicted O-methyltransferase YrrM
VVAEQPSGDTQVPDEVRARLEGPWALTNSGFESICASLDGLSPFRRLLEFGSGASTVAFAHRYPGLEIVSIENSPEYAPQVMPEHSGRVTLEFASLRLQVVDGVLCRTYDIEVAGLFDAVLVDGPRGWLPNGRLGSMLKGWHALREGGLLFLDDARRENELRWAADFRSLTGAVPRFLDAGHGIFAFTKDRTEVGRAGLAPTVRCLKQEADSKFASLRTSIRSRLIGKQ